MLRRQARQALAQRHRIVAPVIHQRVLHGVQQVVELGFRQRDALHPVRLLGRHQQHSARTVGLAPLEEGRLDELAVSRLGGIADHQRALQRVEADHRLQVRVARVDRGQA